MKQVI